MKKIRILLLVLLFLGVFVSNIYAENEDIQWTDFSNAKYEFKRQGDNKAIVEISNVVPNENSTYYLVVTSDSNKPDENADGIPLYFNSNTNEFAIVDYEKLSSFVELNQDLYLSVIERSLTFEKNVVAYGQKIERFSESKYYDAFESTFMSYNSDQIITNFTHSELINRKIQIKIGKISDNSILKKIKNSDSSGFSDLLSYAKSSTGIYDSILNAKKDYFKIEYDASSYDSTNKTPIKLNGLVNGQYYYLYVKTDDENGKYISNEAVTLAQAKVYENQAENVWYMFFYGSTDFKWANFDITTSTDNKTTETNKDTTTSKQTIPYTGTKTILFSVIIISIIIVGVLYNKNKKFKGI